MRKTRRPFELRWDGRTVEAALDDVLGVGTFVELELIADEGDIESAKACVASLANQLQLTTNERRSYLELLLEKTNS